MKKIVLWLAVASFLFSNAAWAEEQKSAGMPDGPMPGMGRMNPPMMGKAQMIATNKGGVIVLAGNKLMKYDSDLNLVKEVQIKMSCPMMDKQCPMRGKMAEQGASQQQEGPGKTV